jgi:uncharacterized protein YqeY
MSRAASWIAFCLLLIGCTPGYSVRLDTSGLQQLDPMLVGQLEDVARSNGLVASMVAHRNDRDRTLTSAYRKELSAKRHDAIQMSVIYSDQQSSEQSLTVFIDNRLRGMEPAVKSQIDALADDCYEVLVKALGRNRLTIERGPASLPVAW